MCFSSIVKGQEPEAFRAKVDSQIIQTEYSIELHETRANMTLAVWSVGSIIGGGIQLLSPNPFVRAFGIQNLVWGSIDGGIAYYGYKTLGSTDWSVADKHAERIKFRKILLINALLDIGYLGLGFALYSARNTKWHGHGAGIMLQGGFLLLFDGINFAITF